MCFVGLFFVSLEARQRGPLGSCRTPHTHTYTHTHTNTHTHTHTHTHTSQNLVAAGSGYAMYTHTHTHPHTHTQPSRNWVAAGYAMYGASTILVLATHNGVNGL